MRMNAASERPQHQERVGVWDLFVCLCLPVHVAHGGHPLRRHFAICE